MFKILAAVLVVGIILAGIGYFTFVGVQASVQDDAEGILVSSAEREAVGIEGFLTDGNDNAVRIFGLNILVDGTDR